MFGRELLSQGLIRSIGNGTSTYVWSQNWIMDNGPRRPINKQRDTDVNLRVAALMGSDGQWDVNKLQLLFPENEVTRILQMQIGDVVDRDIWAYTPQGAYTVKSGYVLASKMKKAEAVRIMESAPGILELKRHIWTVPTIPKIRNFLWRAVSGALAVTERLNTRGLDLDTRCKVCKSAVETIEHVLFKCTMAQDAWSIVGLQPLPSQMHLSLLELLNMYLQKMSDETVPVLQRQAIPWILLTIWKNRNMLL